MTAVVATVISTFMVSPYSQVLRVFAVLCTKPKTRYDLKSTLSQLLFLRLEMYGVDVLAEY
jgi:hypothetical protein